MAQYQRQQRTLDLLRRRHSQNSQLNSTDNASSTTASSPRAAATKESVSDNHKSSSKRSVEDVGAGDKGTHVQSPAGKRSRPAQSATPSSASSAVVVSVDANPHGSSSGINKTRRNTGKKLSKSARRFQKVTYCNYRVEP